MFNHTISGSDPPHYLSSDNDPLFRFHRWKANLRILDVTEIKSVPYAPMSHPFIERVIEASVDIKSYQWQQHCRGLFYTPVAR